MSEPNDELVALAVRILPAEIDSHTAAQAAMKKVLAAAHDAGLIVYREEYEQVRDERDAAETRHGVAVLQREKIFDALVWLVRATQGAPNSLTPMEALTQAVDVIQEARGIGEADRKALANREGLPSREAIQEMVDAELFQPGAWLCPDCERRADEGHADDCPRNPLLLRAGCPHFADVEAHPGICTSCGNDPAKCPEMERR